jgi:8-oxo-dGTP pyrophosphatase MutT (NUDIX family)
MFAPDHEAAARELAEECGLAAHEWHELGTFWCAPAYSTELVHVFEAHGLGEAAPAELGLAEVEPRPQRLLGDIVLVGEDDGVLE